MQPIIFQIIDWIQYNEQKIKSTKFNESDDSDEQDNISDELEKELGLVDDEDLVDKYKIRLYGRTNEGQSIYVNVNDYTPFFYIKVPIDWTNSKILSLMGHIKSKITNKNAIKGLKTFDIVMKKDLYGFTGYKDFKFVRLVFHNMKSYKAFEGWIGNNFISNNLFSKKPFKLQLYESNIEPFIRCMHIQKLNACGWVKISQYEKYESTHSYCGVAIQTNWKNLEPYDSNSIQKLIIASWDIECMSWSGNFPQAIDPEDKEDFDKTIKELVQELKKNTHKYKQEQDIIADIYCNPKKYLKYGNYKFKKSGDPVIQIGTVFSYYGESEPFAKSIITLGGCDKIKGLEDVEIQSFENEKQVLLAWTQLIQRMDPDIMTGWNINGFDFQYLYERAVKLKILDKFSELSRLQGDNSPFREKMLSSSALGDNILKYFDMGGRVVIDLMKVQQRDAKLDSYKLDFVASTYIKEKIVMCKLDYVLNSDDNKIQTNKFTIYTTSVYGIKSDDFVHITWDDGLSENKHDIKYKIVGLEKVDTEELAQLIKMIESYYRYNEFEFKKPKSLYKLEINGSFPTELFEVEEGNEPIWHCIDKPKSKTKLYFQFEDYAHKHNEEHNEKHNEKHSEDEDENLDKPKTRWIDEKLDDVSIPMRGNKIFWAHAKDDISPKELFALYKGSDADRGIIAKYCIMDCVLVTKLMEKLQVLNNNIGMSNVCNVPLNYIFMRGQGVKIFSLVSKKCRELGFLIPKISPNDNKKGKEPEAFDPEHPHKGYKKIRKAGSDSSDSEDSDDEEKVGYEGATVFPPVKGIHYEPIPVLDYASLYPRSMIYMNISHETYVNNPAYDNLQDYEYKTAVYRNSDDTETTCRYAKKKDGTKGVLCIILEELLKKRSDTKKLMEKAKAEGNNFLSAIYDGLQLAYKVTANSLYGQVGAPTSPIYMKELAASTTATGRKMLEFSRDFIEGPFGNLINLALHNKSKYLEEAVKLYTGLCDFGGKDTKTLKDINNDTTQMEKFNERYSSVYGPVPEKKFNEPKVGRKVMDDFINYFYDKINILLSQEYKVKPRIIYGDSVTPDTPIILLNKQTNNVEIKYIKDIGSIWTEYNQFKSDIEGLSEKEQDSNINRWKVWTDKGWSDLTRVIRHKTNKKIYEIITSQGYVKVTSDHSLLDISGNQLKPSECVVGTRLLHSREFEGFKRLGYCDSNEPIEYIQSIVDKYGYYPDSNGTIKFNFDSNELDIATQIYYACRTLGFYVKVEIKQYEKTKRIFIISSKTRPNDYEEFDKIIVINDLGYSDDYVYDLETDIGHFHAGVGSMIVKNTDSVFFTPKIHNIKTKQIKTDRAALRVCIEIGKLAGDTICKILPEPEEQVYEKTLWPFIILTKKRYVGNLYEDDDSHFKQKSMGIVLKRRDNAKIVKIVVGGIVDYILNGKPGETDVEDRNKGAIQYTKTLLKRILQGKYPIDKYVITKTLRANYKGTKMTSDEKGEIGKKGSWYWDDVKCPLAHVTLCQRMKARDPGNNPEANDRVPYVYIIPKGKVTLQGDRVEDPKYVIANNLELDYLFYITNQIMKPSKQFLEHIATNPDKLFENYINKEINRRKKINSVNDYLFEIDEKDNYQNNKYLSNTNNYDLTEQVNNKSKKNVKKSKTIKNKNLDSDSDSDSSESSDDKSNLKNSDLSDKSQDRLINKIKSNNVKKTLTIDI